MSFSKSIKKVIDLWPAALISDQNVNRVQTTESVNMTITRHWSQRGDGWEDKSVAIYCWFSICDSNALHIYVVTTCLAGRLMLQGGSSLHAMQMLGERVVITVIVLNNNRAASTYRLWLQDWWLNSKLVRATDEVQLLSSCIEQEEEGDEEEEGEDRGCNSSTTS